MKKFNIGDIVFVANYEYKNGESGQNHSSVSYTHLDVYKRQM